MKIKQWLAASLAALTLSGCVGQPVKDDGVLSVVTTNFALYDFARAVAGDAAEVTMLLAPGAESHDFEVTLADLAKIAAADVFVSVGNEDWVDDIWTAMGADADDITVVNALAIIEESGTEWVTADGVCTISGEDHDHDHDHGVIDEHVWTSPGNAMVLVDAIADALLAENGDAISIRANTAAYVEKIQSIDVQFADFFATLSKPVVVADRFPFAYFAARYGFAYTSAFSGCSSATEPTLAVISTLVETVRTQDIPVIYTIEFSDGKTAQAIADETGCQIQALQSAHNVTKEDFDAGVTYVDLLRGNLRALCLLREESMQNEEVTP